MDSIESTDTFTAAADRLDGLLSDYRDALRAGEPWSTASIATDLLVQFRCFLDKNPTLTPPLPELLAVVACHSRPASIDRRPTAHG